MGEELGDLAHVAAGLLDADDVGDLGEAENGFGQQVGAGAAGDVVEQDGQVRGLGDGAEVLELAFLAGPVVVGVGGEDAGEAGDLRERFGVGTACAVELWVHPAKTGTRPAAASMVISMTRSLLLLGEGGGFAGGAAGDEERDAAGDLPVDE